MEGFEQQILDLGLNLIGYVVAASLGILIYSARRAKAAARARTAEAAVATATASPSAPGGARQRSSQFLDLRTAAAPKSSAKATTVQLENPSARRYRNRAAIIRQAREMLNDGVPGPTIQRRLPLSEAELALLKQGISD